MSTLHRATQRADSFLATRKLRACVCAGLLAAVSCVAAPVAHANGRLPGATGLAIHLADERQLLLGLSYGLALSRDGGRNWSWMCEGQIEGNGGDVDPAIAMTGDGTLLALSLTNGGVLVSRDDGCSFTRALGPLDGQRGVDLTLDARQPGRVLALTSTIVAEVDRKPIYRNLLAQSQDHGAHWTMLAELPGDMLPETVEVAASDSDRIYVSGTASADPLQGVVERSDDGGRSWTRSTVQLPRGSGSLFLSAIHPSDPDRVWFRVPGRGDVYGLLPTRLWRSTDGATSFEQVADTRAGMLGFALSPDGERVAFGGPLDGLFVGPSDGSAPPKKVAELQVKCLRWTSKGVYVCASEPNDPYSLGYAVDPAQDFVALWRRADTCRKPCVLPSSLEQTCREPWDVIAPLVDAQRAVCGDSPLREDAGAPVDADASEAGPHPLSDAAMDAATAASDATDAASTTERAHGCTLALGADGRTTWWPAALWLLVGACCRRRNLCA